MWTDRLKSVSEDSFGNRSLKKDKEVVMDGGLAVTVISIAMFVGCFLLGFIPLLFRLSEVSALFNGDAVFSHHYRVFLVLNASYCRRSEVWHGRIVSERTVHLGERASYVVVVTKVQSEISSTITRAKVKRLSGVLNLYAEEVHCCHTRKNGARYHVITRNSRYFVNVSRFASFFHVNESERNQIRHISSTAAYFMPHYYTFVQHGII